MEISWTVKRSILVLLLLTVAACDDKKEDTSKTAASASAAPSVAPAASSAAPSATPSATASAPLPNRTDCPKDSAGPGTFDKPCEAKGAKRLMEATWTGKTDDKGPHFNVVNKYTVPILYGRIVAYFYDKSGKQLDVKDSSGGTAPNVSCGGQTLFQGIMKPNEKAVITFSCVKKDTVPEGTAAIEAEINMVGFSTSGDEKKSDFYWKNDDLTPKQRKKGGIK